MAKSRGRKFAEITSPTSGVFDLTSVPTITNAKLQNSAMTLAGSSVSLGGTGVANTDALSEGSSNLYFTNARVQSFLGGGTLAGNVVVPDNRSIYLGSDSDFRMVHNTTNTQLINATGALQITSNGGFDVTGAATFSSTITATGNITGTLATAAQTNITSLGTLTALTSSGDITISTGSGTGGRYLILDNTDTGGRDYRLISTNNAHGSLGGGDFAILDYDVSGNDAAKTRLLINSSGNVGIGDPSPSEKLVLKGDGARMLIESDDYELFSIGRRGSSGAALDDGYIRIKSAGTNTIILDTAGVSHFNGGNVGIGTGLNADELLHIEKSAGTTLVKTEVAANSIVGFQITKTNATTQAWRIVDGQTVNGVLEFYDLTNSATRMAIKGDGSVGIGETNPSGKLQITDGNNYAKFGDFHSNSTMVLQMADSAGFPVEVQAYSSELRFNTTPTSGATPVPRMHIQNDGHIRVNPGAADYDGHTNVDQHLFSVQTSYNSNGDQNLNIVNHNGNWQDGTSGADSAYGLMWGYQNNIRAGIHYDHRGTEKFDFYSGYGSMRFRVRTSVAANQSPIGSETVMPPALTIIPGGNVGIGTARGGITPSASLHVAGENNGYDGTIRIGERGYLAHRDASQTKTWVANNYNSNSASFGVRMKGIADTDEKLTVLGSGSIGIGTTSPSFTAVSGSTSQKGLHIQNSGNDTSAHLKLTGHNNTGTPGQATDFEIIHKGDALQTVFRHGGADVLTFLSSGLMTVQGNAYREVESVYRRAYNLNRVYTHVANINGSGLGTSYEVHVRGTTSSVVVNAHFHIMVGHYKDIAIKSFGGAYTACKVKVVSNNNEDSSLYIGIASINNSTASCRVSIRSHDGSPVDMSPSSAYSSGYLEHQQNATSTQETTTGTSTNGSGPTNAYSI